MIRFEVRPGYIREEYAVVCVDPRSGNDEGLISVFNSKTAAESLAQLLNTLVQVGCREFNQQD